MLESRIEVWRHFSRRSKPREMKMRKKRKMKQRNSRSNVIYFRTLASFSQVRRLNCSLLRLICLLDLQDFFWKVYKENFQLKETLKDKWGRVIWLVPFYFSFVIVLGLFKDQINFIVNMSHRILFAKIYNAESDQIFRKPCITVRVHEIKQAHRWHLNKLLWVINIIWKIKNQ